jgi:hypothetical protein
MANDVTTEGEAATDPAASPVSNPAGVYASRLDARRASHDGAGRRDDRIANARLVLFIIAGVLAWLVLGSVGLHWAWLLLPGAGYVVLMVLHDQALKEKARARRQMAFYEDGLARLGHTWPGKGIAGDAFAKAHHPFALDLDLFGEGSVFERLCRARTRAGEETLAQWLLEPADPETIRARQAAVDDLRERLALREDLAILGEDIRAEIDAAALRSWATAPAVLRGIGMQIVAALLSVGALFSLVAWFALDLGPLPFLVSVGALGVLYWRTGPSVAEVVGTVEKPGKALGVLAGVLARLESETFEAPLLRRLQADLAGSGEPASKRIAALGRLVDLLGARRNQFFIPIAFVLAWSLHLAVAVERWRARSGRQVGGWLFAVGELEALSSLAAYAYECPGDPFPTILDGGPRYVAVAAAHPLLKDAVPNDLHLGEGGPQVLLVSGSNMSGKSTLLRTVGVNAVLALAGAPVRAERLELSPLALGATLRVQDSLQEGASRFYAEITRLKQILDLTAADVPVLFLLDEVLHGTNSHDRRIGAQAVVRGLMARGAVGLVTTHDLALAKMAEAVDAMANVHFEDHVEDGEIRFDYKMRTGVVEKSNAIALMRAVGLEV